MPEPGWLSWFQCGIQTSNTYLLYGRGSRPGSPTTDYIIRQSRFSRIEDVMFFERAVIIKQINLTQKKKKNF